MSAPNEQVVGQMTWPCTCGHPKGDHYFGDGLDANGQPHTSCQRSDGCHRFTPATPTDPAADRVEEALSAESEKLLRDFGRSPDAIDYNELSARLWMIERSVRSTAPATGPGLDAGPWFAHFSTHGDPSIVTDPERPGFTTIATVSTAPDDYGRANALLIVSAVNAALRAATEARSGVDEVGEGLREAERLINRAAVWLAFDQSEMGSRIWHELTDWMTARAALATTQPERGSGPPLKGPYDPDAIRERVSRATQPERRDGA